MANNTIESLVPEEILEELNKALTIEQLTDYRRRLLAGTPIHRRFKHRKSGRIFCVRDVVFLHANGLKCPAFVYCEVVPMGQEAPFVRPVVEFFEEFLEVEQESE